MIKKKLLFVATFLIAAGIVITGSHAFASDIIETILYSVLGLLIIGSGARIIYLSMLAPELQVSPPPMTVIESRITVKFIKADGSLADYLKVQKYIAHSERILSFFERGLRGYPEGSRVEIRDAGKGVFVKEIRRADGGTEWEFVFETSPPRGVELERKIHAHIHDSFPDNPEFFRLNINRQIKVLILTIIPHKDRPFEKAWRIYKDEASQTHMGVNEETFELKRNDAGKIEWLQLTLNYPRLGGIHTIYWKW